VNLVPITISGNEVSSIIGSWSVTSPPFQGEGVALVRPESFSTVAAGEESDLIVAVEEANFENGRWVVRAILSGAFTLRIALPAASHLHKGKLMALKFDASAFTLTNSAV